MRWWSYVENRFHKPVIRLGYLSCISMGGVILNTSPSPSPLLLTSFFTYCFGVGLLCRRLSLRQEGLIGKQRLLRTKFVRAIEKNTLTKNRTAHFQQH